ncbi:MAG: SPOR domain-containing protein [Pseudoclavibacter sp.]
MTMAYWFNIRTKQVEEGAQSLGVERLGPFETAAEAARAPQIVQERAQAWAAEDAADEQRQPPQEDA